MKNLTELVELFRAKAETCLDEARTREAKATVYNECARRLVNQIDQTAKEEAPDFQASRSINDIN